MPANFFGRHFWYFVTIIGGIGFILAGIFSFFNYELITWNQPSTLLFLPNGMLLEFYGTIAVLSVITSLIFILLDIGNGYNEYNKIEEVVRIIRNGFPGKNRKILMTYPFSEIEAIQLRITDGLNVKRQIYLRLKDSRLIPLLGINKFFPLFELEIIASAYLYKNLTKTKTTIFLI